MSERLESGLLLANEEQHKVIILKKPQRPQLTLKQKLALKTKGRVFLRYEIRDDWTGPLTIYAAKCGKHGLFEDYLHGWEEELECPECLLERIRR